MATKIFSSYAQKDARFVDQLKMYLSPLKQLGEIEAWYDHEISADTEFVLVSPVGNKVFQQMVDQWQFGAFAALPPDSLILRSIRVSPHIPSGDQSKMGELAS